MRQVSFGLSWLSGYTSEAKELPLFFPATIRSAKNSKKVTFIRAGFSLTSDQTVLPGRFRFFFVPRNEYLPTRLSNLAVQIRAPFAGPSLGSNDRKIFGAPSMTNSIKIPPMYSSQPVCRKPVFSFNQQTFRVPPAPSLPNSGSTSVRRCPSATSGSRSSRVIRTQSDRFSAPEYIR